MSIREQLSKETAIKIAYGWDSTVRNKWNDIEVLADLIATALNDQAAEYVEVLEDKKRLTRELDVAMHGEEGAAKQAALCDLIPMAKQMREELKTLRAGWAAHIMTRAIEEPVRDAIIQQCLDTIEHERRYFDEDGLRAANRISHCLRKLKTSPSNDLLRR